MVEGAALEKRCAREGTAGSNPALSATPVRPRRKTRPERRGPAKPLTSLRNIGAVTASKLERIGIRTAEDFLARDPYEVFDELREKIDPTLCRCALAGLVGAREHRTWHTVTRKSAAEYERRHPGHRWGPC